MELLNTIDRHNSLNLDIGNCCFRETSSDTYGTAIHFDSDGTSQEIHASTFYGCYSSEPATHGTISDKKGGQVRCLALNFTDCRPDTRYGTDRGFFLSATDAGAGELTFDLCTVLNCAGSSGFHSFLKTRPVVEYSNFYGNSVAGTLALLYANTVGMDVHDCIFNGPGQLLGYDLAPAYLSAEQRFSLVKCVFSGSVPTLPGDFYTELGNVGETVTASFVIPHFATFYCPTASPTRSRWPIPSRSPAATPTKAQTAAQPSESPKPTKTEIVSQTPTPTVSFSPTPTISQTWFCDIYENLDSRVISYSVFCVEIRDSVFVETREAYGGGICIWHKTPTVNISGCTFHKCGASSGGGLDYSGSSLDLSESCFRSTSATDRGTAISLSDGSGLIDVREVNFCECQDADGSASGTVSVSGIFACSYHLLNFTDCKLSSSVGEGSIIEVSEADGNWTFLSCNVCGCVGFSGIGSGCEAVCYVRWCNFVDNLFSPFSGVLSCSRTGLFVDSCVFENNSNEIVLGESSEIGFVIVNCVFSSDLPDDSYYLSTTLIFVQRKTSTRYLSHFDTAVCPAGRLSVSSTDLFTSFPSRSPRVGTIFRCLTFEFIFF
jgi:hypothetical protein